MRIVWKMEMMIERWGGCGCERGKGEDLAFVVVMRVTTKCGMV